MRWCSPRSAGATNRWTSWPARWRSFDRLKGTAAQPEQVLAGDYPPGVRAWGELMGALDPSALRHAERVAQGVMELAGALGYDPAAQAKVRVGAYLTSSTLSVWPSGWFPGTSGR